MSYLAQGWVKGLREVAQGWREEFLGGVSGGSMGGVIGGVTSAAPLAPKREAPRAPVRVGGHVKEPKLIRRVEPIYPLLAKQTRQQGSVVIEAN